MLHVTVNCAHLCNFPVQQFTSAGGFPLPFFTTRVPDMTVSLWNVPVVFPSCCLSQHRTVSPACFVVSHIIQWRRGMDHGQFLPPPLNFSLSENFLLVLKFYSKNTKFVAENPPYWLNFGAKLKLWAPIISSVGNLRLFVGKLQLWIGSALIYQRSWHLDVRTR